MRDIISSIRLLAAAACLLPLGLNAQDVPPDDFFACAAIYDDRDRIDCYDQLAGSLVDEAPAGVTSSSVTPTGFARTGVRGVGRWEVSVETDSDNRATAVTVTVAADSEDSQSDEPITLVMRCRDGNTDLYIGWQDYLGNEASVQTRVGDQNPVTQKWNLSASHQSSFFPESPIEFISQLLETDRLVAQVSPYRASPLTATFI